MSNTKTTPFTAPRNTTAAAVVVSLLGASALFAGDGSNANPWLNAEVTNATLDSTYGTVVYNKLDAFTATQWDATKDVIIGSATNGNALSIIKGSTITCRDFDHGFGSGADHTLGCNNFLEVNASTITAAGDFSVGVYGSGNFAFMSTNSVVTCNSVALGCTTFSAFNSLDIGEGTTITAANYLYVGIAGPDNGLMIVNAAIHCKNAALGVNDGADRNRANVNGATGLLACTLDLSIGSMSSDNAVRVHNDGDVTAASLKVGVGFFDGERTYGDHNTLEISDAGSTVTISTSTMVGDNSGGNVLSVRDSGSFSTASAIVGSASTASGNRVEATGAGSTINSGSFTIGDSGSGNGLFISNGAEATLSTLTLGVNNVANGNSLTVTGTGSSLATTGDLIVGNSGAGNAALVDDGATAHVAGNANIGYQAPASGTCSDNSLKVRGPGSHLAVAGSLQVGATATVNNLFTVQNGALASIGMSGSGTLAIGTGTGNAVRLANGKIALGNMTIADVQGLLAQGGITIWNATSKTWDTATAATVSTVTIGAGQSKAMTGVDGLDGTLLVSGGDDHINWCNATLLSRVTVGTGDDAYTGGWYSSWYGSFYAAPSHDGRWIWHSNHGWQYVESLGSSDFAVWDNAVQSWWYVNQEWYPAMYNYGDGAWYYFTGGTYPNRRFWDYASDKEISFTEQ